KRSVSIPYMVATGHGSSDTCVGLFALGNHGQSGRLSNGSFLASPGWDRGVAVDIWYRWADHLDAWRLCRYLSTRYERCACLLHCESFGINYFIVGSQYSTSFSGRRFPYY